MAVVISAFAAFALIMVILAVGSILGRRPIKGSCGGQGDRAGASRCGCCGDQTGCGNGAVPDAAPPGTAGASAPSEETAGSGSA